MKIKYSIIIILLAFVIASAIAACSTTLEEIRYEREAREESIRRSELGRKKRECFEELTEYCREHEDMYMEISEQIFYYLDEGLSIKEACTAMENNATSEQKEILDQITLKYPGYSDDFEDSTFEELVDNGLYYFMKDGYVGVKAIYIHEYSEETEEYILSRRNTIKEKINDHLYVCYTWIPYT